MFMKKIIHLALIFSLIIVAAGCSDSDIENNAMEIVTNFKKSQYEIDDYKKIPNEESYQYFAEKGKGYLTEEEFDNMMANRNFGIVGDLAKNKNLNTFVSDFKVKEKKREEEQISFKYEMMVNFKNELDEIQHQVPVNGEVELIKTKDNELKINRDWDDLIKNIPVELRE